MDESFLAPAQPELAVYARTYCACSRCLWRLFGQFSLPYRLFSFSVCLRDGSIKSKILSLRVVYPKTTKQTTSPFAYYVRWLNTVLWFSSIFTKENNFCGFLFASLKNKAIPNARLLLKERICFWGSKFFPSTVDPYEKGDKMELTELLPLKIYQCTFKLISLSYQIVKISKISIPILIAQLAYLYMQLFI